MPRSSLVFPHEQFQLILQGRRTLVVLPRGDDPDDEPPHRAGSRIGIQLPPKKRKGKPPLTRKAAFHVEVTNVTDISLGQLDDEKAHALGRRDLEAFMRHWVGPPEQGGLGLLWNENARAWLISIEVDPTIPARFLRDQSGRHGRRALWDDGYTTEAPLAMHGELPAVDEWALRGFGTDAIQAERERLEQIFAARERLPTHERLRLIIDDAAAIGVPVDRDVKTVTTIVSLMERRVLRAGKRARASEPAA